MNSSTVLLFIDDRAQPLELRKATLQSRSYGLTAAYGLGSDIGDVFRFEEVGRSSPTTQSV